MRVSRLEVTDLEPEWDTPDSALDVLAAFMDDDRDPALFILACHNLHRKKCCVSYLA